MIRRWGRRGSDDEAGAVPLTVRWGVAGAVVTLLCAGMVALLAMPPFLPADESSHAGYALEVADGRLPRLEDTVRAELPGQRPLRMYLANHPPLYYAIAGPVLEWGADSGHGVAAVRIVRGFSLALAAGTVVVTAALAGVVVRRRRTEAMILAAGLAATVPTFVSTSAMIHNDLLAVFTAALAYYGAALALVRGPRWANVALVCGGSAVTMATRLNGAPIVALACAALGLAVLLHGTGSPARRLVRAALLGAAPLVAAGVASGWFYLRNVRIYGDVSGVGHNRDLGGRTDVYTPIGYLTDWMSLPDLLTRLENGGPWRHIQFFGWYDRKALAVVSGLVVLGGILCLVDAGRRAWSDRRAAVTAAGGVPGAEASDDVEAVDDAGRAERAERLGRWAAVALVLSLPVLLWVQLAGYVSQTGTPNPRYLFPGIPAVATVVAVCCLAYRRRAGVLVGVLVLGFQATIGFTTLGRWLTRRTAAPATDPLTQLRRSLEGGGLRAPTLLLAVLLAGTAVGIAVQGVAMWRATSQPRPSTGDGPGPDDADDERPAGIGTGDAGDQRPAANGTGTGDDVGGRGAAGATGVATTGAVADGDADAAPKPAPDAAGTTAS